MFLDNIESFSDSDETSEKVSKNSILRDKYRPKTCSSQLDFDNDINGIKCRADLLYLQGQFLDAKLLYSDLYMRQDIKSSFLKRDLAESISRTCLSLGPVLNTNDKPLSWFESLSIFLLMTFINIFVQSVFLLRRVQYLVLILFFLTEGL